MSEVLYSGSESSYGLRASPIRAAKEAVRVVNLAERLCGAGVQRGREVYFLCPLHDDHDPSLRVNPGKDVWWCDPCIRGGDVIELARLVWGYSQREVAMAAAQLLTEFGYKIPARPPAWHRKQSRQEKIRAEIEREKVEHVRLLVFRMIWIPWLKRLPQFVREEVAESAWQISRSMALNMYERRRRA